MSTVLVLYYPLTHKLSDKQVALLVCDDFGLFDLDRGEFDLLDRGGTFFADLAGDHYTIEYEGESYSTVNGSLKLVVK